MTDIPVADWSSVRRVTVTSLSLTPDSLRQTIPMPSCSRAEYVDGIKPILDPFEFGSICGKKNCMSFK